MYTAVVSLIITYAATVQWPRPKFKTGKAELSKLQRMACLGIKGAMRMTPTAAVEVLLGLLSLHLQLETQAKAGIYGLYCNKQWEPKSEGFGHAHMTWNMQRERVLQIKTDNMLPRYAYDRALSQVS
jgi:hypothetical protein